VAHERRHREEPRAEGRGDAVSKDAGEDARRRPQAQAIVEALDVRLEARGRAVAGGLDYGECSEHAGLDGGPDPLTALRIRKARGIADEQHAGSSHAAARRVRHEVRVPSPSAGEVSWNPAARSEVRDELGGGLWQRAFVEAAEADVEILLLADAPAVALAVTHQAGMVADAREVLRHAGALRVTQEPADA
jgi:hypothetical protein